MSILNSLLSLWHQKMRRRGRQPVEAFLWRQPFRSLQGWKWLLLALAVSCFCIAPAFGGDGYSSELETIARGETITITTATPPAAGERARLVLIDEDGQPVLPYLESQMESSDGTTKSFDFALPADLIASRYTAKMLIGGSPDKPNPAQISVVFGEKKHRILTIEPEQGSLSPAVKSIIPQIAYPQLDGSYRLEINGHGFSPKPEDNILMLSKKDTNGDGMILISEGQVCWQGSSAYQPCTKQHPNWSTGIRISARQLVVNLKKPSIVRHQALFGLQIRVGEKASTPEIKVVLSDKGRWVPLVSAVGIVAVLTAIGIMAFNSTLKQKDQLGQPRKSLFDALLIDPETNTYSLSRGQFLLWTGVTVFGYFYLFVASWLVQGRLHFFDVPDGLPGIVMISAATTSFASGITSSKGSKGSGAINPSLSDFLSAGGSVLPERLQFAVWTVIGAGVYLLVIISQDPGAIEILPVLPQGFLQLSGISSLGYLGGKLARKPGPVISEITAENISPDPAKAGTLKLTLSGSHLSKNLRFRIQQSPENSNDIYKNSWEFDADAVTVDLVDPGDEAEGNQAVITIKPSSSDENRWCYSPTTAGPNKLPAGFPDHFHLRIYNPDGQWADWKFSPIQLAESPPRHQDNSSPA